jgi:hypothetical protein
VGEEEGGEEEVSSTTTLALTLAVAAPVVAEDLVGHWPLRGDARDRSGHGNHGEARGDGAARGAFDSRTTSVVVPPGSSLRLERSDFSLCAWISVAPEVTDAPGDIISRYDPARRRGFHLSLISSAGGYNSHGDDRHVFFGIDDGRQGEWEDCGRPSPGSNYISNSLTVFDGHLYAAITDAPREEDWCHIFRYRGGQAWEDCGRVGELKTRGVGPMVVHQGSLYAATWSYDWTRVGVKRPRQPPYEADFCRVYRYAGGTKWEDCGQPGSCRRLFGLASFRGKLYVAAEDGRCYAYAGGQHWEESGRFPNYAHPFGVHDGKLYAGVLNPAGVWAFDGAAWKPLGNPQGSEDRCDQIHALEVYRGKLHATTWPEGHVVRLDPEARWVDCGRLGDALEVNALCVYNGKLYGGSIPRAEVFRYEGGTSWTSMRRFLEPAGYQFKDPKEWARVTSLTVYAGKLFAGMGSCTSSHLDAPLDFRGKVHAFEAGKGVSHDRDLGPGWKQITAVKRGGRLELWVGGEKTAESSPFDAAAFDLSSDEPLRIGVGETDGFSGRIREVRVYARALAAEEIQRLAGEKAPE